jgi:hypothetical protein
VIELTLEGPDAVARVNNVETARVRLAGCTAPPVAPAILLARTAPLEVLSGPAAQHVRAVDAPGSRVTILPLTIFGESAVRAAEVAEARRAQLELEQRLVQQQGPGL